MDAWNSAFFSLSGLTEKSSWTLYYQAGVYIFLTERGNLPGGEVMK